MNELVKDFLKYIKGQGVVGLAVGLAIGVAAASTVAKIVNGFINPLVGFILGGTNLSGLVWDTSLSRNGHNLVFLWGSIANSLIILVTTALLLYIVVRYLKLDKK